MTIERIGDARLVRLSGSLDIANAEAIGARMTQELGAEAGVIAIDIGGLEYCDSAGVRTIYQLRRHLTAAGHDLRVVLPPTSPVRRLFEVVGFAEALPLYDSVDGALITGPRPPEGAQGPRSHNR